MSQFIDIKDYDASLHREILDALVRDDETLVEICEDRAIAEMRGYLSKGTTAMLSSPQQARSATSSF